MHRSPRASIICLAIAAALGVTAGAAVAHPDFQGDAVRTARAAEPETQTRAPVVVYVNRYGGSVSAGEDDSHAGTSSLVKRGTAKIPAWRGGDARWKQVMSCVRDRFSPFAIELTEERPQSGDYIEAMVGGKPSVLGYDHDISGIAPYTGDVMPNAIVYVFAAGIDNDVDITCVDVLHEVGHALGLDHEYLCQDPMSYLWDCEEPKTFQDADATCGEDEPRACEDGSATQNSYRILARNVGLRSAPAPTELPATPAPDDATSDDGGVDDPPAPADLGVTLDAPSGLAEGNRVVSIVVHGRGQVADAALAWLLPEGRYTFDCAAMPADTGATCARAGDDFVFRLEVGTGWRYFAAAVVDTNGRAVSSQPASAYFQ
jgi:hypothetical protein